MHWTCFVPWTVGGSQRTRREPTRATCKLNKDRTLARPAGDLNPKPSCCEATALTASRTIQHLYVIIVRMSQATRIDVKNLAHFQQHWCYTMVSALNRWPPPESEVLWVLSMSRHHKGVKEASGAACASPRRELSSCVCVCEEKRWSFTLLSHE